MILSHFTKEPFKFDRNRKYVISDKKAPFKCEGLWLSDENTDLTWKSWCEGEEFHLDYLTCETTFEVNISEILFLGNYDAISWFNQKYKKSLFKSIESIDWQKVQDENKGLIISPYCWKARLEFMWYYGWDCASACIWDLKTLALR